jgi:hypothetical protein
LAFGCASLTYCTYICSTSNSPFGSTLSAGMPGLNATSLTGIPLSVAARPPMWKLPTSLTRYWPTTGVATVATAPAAANVIAIARMMSSRLT